MRCQAQITDSVWRRLTTHTQIPPTVAQLNFMKKISEAIGVPLPKCLRTRIGASRWIDKHIEEWNEYRDSQVTYILSDWFDNPWGRLLMNRSPKPTGEPMDYTKLPGGKLANPQHLTVDQCREQASISDNMLQRELERVTGKSAYAPFPVKVNTIKALRHNYARHYYLQLAEQLEAEND